MNILVLNAGSSTIKFRLLEAPGYRSLAQGVVEDIAEGTGLTHREGLERVLTSVGRRDVQAVGHRLVHGGEKFSGPTLLTEAVIQDLRALSALAPLHNPAGVLGIDLAREAWPSVPQVAVFDTAFHRTLPPHAYRYAIPEDLYRERGIRRYGFHGISHGDVVRRTAAILQRAPGTLNLISLHLGNGASAAAVRDGRSVDTSMGFTPLEGLVMGTRSGDLDPAVVAHLQRTTARTPDQVEELLNRESGLLGLAGTRDMRDIERRAQAGDARATLALDLFCYRVKKYVGAYAAALGRLDAVVFTGGIGEHSAIVRSRSLENLSILGIALDESKNRASSAGERELQAGDGVRILVLPADEERAIAEQTAACLASA